MGLVYSKNELYNSSSSAGESTAAVQARAFGVTPEFGSVSFAASPSLNQFYYEAKVLTSSYPGTHST